MNREFWWDFGVGRNSIILECSDTEIQEISGSDSFESVLVSARRKSSTGAYGFVDFLLCATQELESLCRKARVGFDSSDRLNRLGLSIPTGRTNPSDRSDRSNRLVRNIPMGRVIRSGRSDRVNRHAEGAEDREYFQILVDSREKVTSLFLETMPSVVRTLLSLGSLGRSLFCKREISCLCSSFESEKSRKCIAISALESFTLFTLLNISMSL